jgi:hypothetical protein
MELGQLRRFKLDDESSTLEARWSHHVTIHIRGVILSIARSMWMCYMKICHGVYGELPSFTKGSQGVIQG